MIFETATTLLMGGISAYAYLKQHGSTNDSDKIQKIFTLAGLNQRDGKKVYTTELVRKKEQTWGVEYVYRIPLGKEFKDYQAKLGVIQDGLSVRADKSLLSRITKKKKIHTKEVELTYDGMLHVKVYHQAFPKEIPYLTEDLSGWRVPLGVTRDGTEKYIDFEDTPHVVLGGATRYGKSNLLNSIVTSLVYNQARNVEFTFIDLKGGVELSDYECMQQTHSIAYEPEEALQSLKKAYLSMRTIQEKLKQKGAKKVQSAHIYKRHFVIIDEVGELNPSEAISKEDKKIKEECQKYMSQIARLGAGLGFRLICATQYPTGDVIPRTVKQNSDAKLCFRVQSEVASRVVLDSQGAEQLPAIKGRAILQMADRRETVQTYLINNEVINQVVSPYITNESKREGVTNEEILDGETGADTFVIEETDFSE